jgi:glycerophosphoryl diester phosphodiesterase
VKHPAPWPWPYPYWIAHRGAGKLAPENTLAAFEVGAKHGYRCFECDVKLSSDEIPFLMHDAELMRTTGMPGLGGDLPWRELVQLDAGSWHSASFEGEPLPPLVAVAEFVRANDFTLNIEIKPTPGDESRTGTVVAREVRKLWDGADVPPLLSSFQPDALAAAMAAEPKLPRALLLDDFWNNWEAAAERLRCVAIVCNHRRLDEAVAQRVRLVVDKLLVYTVNEPDDVQRVEALGVDGIITDAVDRFRPSVRA